MTSTLADKISQIAKTLQEMNAFANYKVSEFFLFLKETGFIQNLICGKEFDAEKYLYPDKYDSLEDLCKSLDETICGIIVRLSKAWIRTVSDLNKLIRVISYEFPVKTRFEVIIELAANFSYEIYRKRLLIRLDIGNRPPILEVYFAYLLRELTILW